jgi:uncharacterized delta-60 repeat protein
VEALEGRTLFSAGDLDPTFGSGGKVTAGVYSSAVFNSTAVQSDGHIVAAGMVSTSSGNQFGVARYNSDGSPDYSFYGSGMVTTSFGSSDDEATSVASQSDGRIVAAGFRNDQAAGGHATFALARYNTDGTADTSFGASGRITTSFGGVDDRASSMVVQSNGRIIAAGTTRATAGGSGQFALERFTSTGAADTTFGNSGKVITAFGSTDDELTSIALQSDGKILAAGFTVNGSTRSFAVARYNTNGSLDTTFGTGGKVTTTFGVATQAANGVVVQSNGQIVVAGYALNGTEEFALARYNTNGSLDTTFGSGGKVTTSYGTNTHEIVRSVALQPDGRIVVAGSSTPFGPNPQFALACYNSDGSLDTTFAGGITVVPFGGAMQATATSLAVQSDGRIVATGGVIATGGTSSGAALVRLTSTGNLDTSFGYQGTGYAAASFPSLAFAYSTKIQTDGRIVAVGSTSSNGLFGVARFNSNGTLDTSFGNNGQVATGFSGPGYQSIAYGVALQSDGKIVAAGYTIANGSHEFALVRYNSNGTLDTTFGTGGRVLTSFRGVGVTEDLAFAVAIQPDGKIIAAGDSFDNQRNGGYALVRYNSNGSLDTSFGTGGKVTTSTGNPISNVAVQSDGRIVVAGGSGAGFELARYNSNGSLDTSFGNAGMVLTSFGSGTLGAVSSVAVQADGHIVAAGYTGMAGVGTQFALARYNSDGSLDNSFGSSGKVTTSYGGTQDEATSVVVQPNGRIIAAGYTSTRTTEEFALARYNTDGSLDSTFGASGKVTTSFGSGSFSIANSVALQTDGRIVAAGQGGGGFTLARYLGDGTTSHTALSSSVSPSVYGGSVTFTATVTVGGQPATAGSVTFTDGSTVLQTVNVNGTGHAAYTTTRLTAAGSPHTITAAYDGGGGGGTSNASVQQIVTPAPLHITADNKTKVAGQAVPTLTATYSGFVNGDTPASLTTPVTFSTYTGNTAGSYAIIPSGATSGNYTITFVNGTLTVTPAAAVMLQINAPTVVTAGQSWNMTVAAMDPYGNIDTNFVGSFHLAVNPEFPDLGNSTFTLANHGVVGFAGFGLYVAGVDTIVASGAVSGQANITVNPAAAVAFVINAPAAVTAGQSWNMTVAAVDPYGNIDTNYVGSFQLSIYPEYPNLLVSTFTPANQGVVGFVGFGLYGAGTDTIVAAGDLYGQASITVNPDMAAFLVLNGPSNATAGTPFTVTVIALDAYGNVATGYLGTVTFTCNDAAATLPIDYPFQPGDQGTQNFQVTLGTPGMTWTVMVTDTVNYSLTASLSVTV